MSVLFFGLFEIFCFVVNYPTSWGCCGKQENSGRLEVTREVGTRLCDVQETPWKKPQRTQR